MRRIAALIAFTLVVVVGATGLSIIPAAAAAGDDLDTIITRLEDYYAGQGDEIIIANGVYLARVSDALDYVESQNANGSWSDVNYADRTSSANGSVWSAYIALYRMLALTQAYRDPEAEGYNDPRLLDAVQRALLYWDQANPGNSNWWETEVGESIAMGRISMFIGEELSEPAFEVALKHNTGKLDPVGANGVWRTSNYIFEALATRDSAKVTEGFATMVATIAVDHSGAVTESVQPDASFWAHGAQLYSEGYGMVLFTYVALWADVARGTDLAFTREQLDSIAFYFIDGTRWLIRGEIGMLYLNYRPPASSGDVTSHAADFIEPLQRMVRTDALYSTAYAAVLDGILGKTRNNGVTGDKYFWRSEFSSHIRDDYGIFTRLNSSRTFGAELRTTYRDDLGNPVYWNAMGSTAIQVNNREYLDLGPTFDWWHYPGVTAPDAKRTERGVENRGRNGDGGSFTGGVSNGEYGASVLTLDTAGTNAQKSYFSFDDEMVALGSGIRSTSGAAVHTTVNQAVAKPNATVNGEAVADGADSTRIDGARWAYNDEVGYVFGAGQNIAVSNKTQTGHWEGDGDVSRDAFTLYVDHGVQPAAAAYDYTVLPAASPAAVKAYASDPAVRTLRNDTTLQAVRHDELALTMATFYSAGSLDLGGGRTLSVDEPAIVILDESGDAPVVSISNPDQPGLTVSLSLSGSGSSWHRVFELGTGENMGKTVTGTLRSGVAPPAASAYSASHTAAGSDVDALGDGSGGAEWKTDRAGVVWVQERLARGSWVTKATINWGDAFARDFVIQTSADGTAWTDQKHVTSGTGGTTEVAITPIAAEYVRVLLLDGDQEGYGIRELTVDSSINLAIGSATRASGYSAYNLVYAIADGDPTTRWRGSNTDTTWAQVDFGSQKTVSTVRLSWEAAFAKNYKIQLSDDGTTWRDAYVTPTAGSDGGVDVITFESQSARFVRMQTTKRALDYAPSIWEFEVFSDRSVVDAPVVPNGKGNLALNRPTTADSFYNNNATVVASKATDGAAGTKWSSARAAVDHWLQVDLGDVLTVSRAVVSWESGTSNNYRIEGSVNGTTWIPLAQVQTAQATLKHVHDFAPKEVRYVRLTGMPSTQYGLNIWEFELYGGYAFDCAASLTTGVSGSGVVAGVLSPAEPGAEFTATTLDATVATVVGAPRAGSNGRVEADIAAHAVGTTRIALGLSGTSTIAWCTVTVTADTSRLAARMDDAGELDSREFTPRSWAPMVRALEAARQVASTTSASQADVDRALAKLAAAVDALVRRDATPSAPREVEVELRERDVARVTWSPPATEGGSAISDYEVTVGDTVVIVDGDEEFAVVDDLAEGEHSVTVRARNAGGWSEASTPVTFVVEPVAPTIVVSGSLRAGGTLIVSGIGFTSAEKYRVELRSEPTLLGDVVADGSGGFRLASKLPRGVPAGAHTVVVMLDGVDVASVPVSIAAADAVSGSDPDGLATTGTDVAWPLGAAALLLLAGVAMILIRRRLAK